MKNSKLTLLILGLSLFAWSLTSDAQTESVLYSFSFNKLGAYDPYPGLTIDAAGNLYGTTVGDPQAGGSGVVFELSAGSWQAQILHKFSGTDGAAPGGGLILDAAGNLYGSTYQGGPGQCKSPTGVLVGCGVVFELSRPVKGGAWTETVLHNFNNGGKDGSFPYGGVISDGAGNLYGTTSAGGAYGGGTAFELSPKVGGGWSETILCMFGKTESPSGSTPSAGLVFDDAGNLYGTTAYGGAYRTHGTVFQLSPPPKTKIGGGWLHTLLHSFGAPGDGVTPLDSLIIDSAGNLYGTTFEGGTLGAGIVFEISPVEGGGWTENILHSFGTGSDGNGPFGAVTFDGSGDLYGTTALGGFPGSGTVFKLSPNGDGTWTESVIHSFGSAGDGSVPEAGVIFDAAGNLYGTTGMGGAHNYGTVFEIANP